MVKWCTQWSANSSGRKKNGSGSARNVSLPCLSQQSRSYLYQKNPHDSLTRPDSHICKLVPLSWPGRRYFLFTFFRSVVQTDSMEVSKTSDFGSYPNGSVIALWCNGNMSDSDSEIAGSNPVRAALGHSYNGYYSGLLIRQIRVRIPGGPL